MSAWFQLVPVYQDPGPLLPDSGTIGSRLLQFTALFPCQGDSTLPRADAAACRLDMALA